MRSRFANAALPLAMVGVAVLGACGTILSDDIPPPPPDAGTPAPSASGSASTSGGTSSGAPAIDAGRACERSTETVTVQAETLLSDGAPALNFGSLAVCNLAVGRCIFRFAPSTEGMTAFREGKIRAMAIRVRRADEAIDCAPVSDCRPLRHDGVLRGFPLRNDWVEGQATWNDRALVTGWAAPGATGPRDTGPVAGTKTVLALETTVSFDLEPAGWTGAFVEDGKVSVALEFQDVDLGARRQFVIVTKDGNARPAEPAQLSFTYCR